MNGCPMSWKRECYLTKGFKFEKNKERDEYEVCIFTVSKRIYLNGK